MERYPTPKSLVQALHAHSPTARTQLWDWVREPAGRLVDGLIVRHHLAHDRDVLTIHALHLVETWLRTRDPDEFGRSSFRAFQAALLLRLARLAIGPAGDHRHAANRPARLPECAGYICQTLFLPSEQVGGNWFGGDWFGGVLGDDGSLWVLIADVTGHGAYAHLVARSLPLLWRTCWDRPSVNGRSPAGVLTEMHEAVERCLPEGVYVEASLTRLDATGRVLIAPGGGVRVLLRRATDGEVSCQSLRGTWLGLNPPNFADQRAWSLAPGDELLLASDGLYDQLASDKGAQPDWARVCAAAGPSTTLLEAIEAELRRDLGKRPQRDDITLVGVRRTADSGRPSGGC